MLLRRLDKQARTSGGAVYMLNGNHESLNVCGDFRHAPPPAAHIFEQRAAMLKSIVVIIK
jgi:hypothetical protein